MFDKIEVKSQKSIDELIESIETNLKLKGFGILAKINFKDKFRDKGIDYNKNIISMDVCNPILGLKVLESDLEAAYLLPCKITIIEEYDGMRVGFLKPTDMVKALNNSKLEAFALEVEYIMNDAINKAK